MKHKLLKTMLLLFALVAGTSMSWATDVTFTFNTDSGIAELGIAKPSTGAGTSLSTSSLYALSGVNMSVTHGGTDTRVWNSSGTLDLRIYKNGGSLTFTAPANITSIVLVGSTVNLFNANVGTFSSGTWTGNAASVTLTATGTGKINTIKVTYSAASITSLSVKTAPTKVRYEVGETLNMSGFVLNADGEDVTSGYTMTMGGAAISNGAILNSAGKKTITVAYGGKEVSQNISVGAVQSIAVTTPPNKTSYDTGDLFDPTGMVVTASLSTGELSDPDTWTKEVTGYTYSPTTTLAPANMSITISYAGQNTTQPITVTNVDVTGVSVKASTTIEKEKTETLTPTIYPANATNKNVSWESDNTDVATVSANGVVTAVAAGTANITVTTEDGDFTATCIVTVVNEKGSIDAPYTVAEVKNGDAKGKTDVYVIGYIVGSYNSTAPVKSGSLVDTNFALADNAGETNGSNTMPVELTSSSGLRTSWGPLSNPYNIDVAKVIIKGNGQTYFSVNAIKGTSEITKVAEAVKVTSVGYATWASNSPLDFAGTDIEAYVGTISSTRLTFTPINQIPANTGVLLVADGETTAEVPVIASADPVANNCLTGTVPGKMLTADDYILNVVDGKAGFYLAGSDHKRLGAHRAYISADAGAGVKSFFFDLEDDATGLISLTPALSEGEGAIYNLAGQRMNKMQKGINIVNGKKVMK